VGTDVGRQGHQGGEVSSRHHSAGRRAVLSIFAIGGIMFLDDPAMIGT
jgi:hypothetical protein